MRKLLPLLAFLLAPTLAHAGGSFILDPDAVGISQGGAFIAAPDTLSAFWYNPASLAHNRGLQLQVEAGFQHTPMDYKRATNEVTGEEYARVRNRNPFKVALLGAVTYDFGVPGLAVGFTAYSPTAAMYDYPEDGAQRYQQILVDNIVGHFHLGVAYRVFPWMSLGVTFGNTLYKTRQKIAVSAAIDSLTSNPEDPDFSVPFTIDVTDPFTITSNFGMRFDPVKQLSIGASLTPPFDIIASGTGTVELPQQLRDAGVEVTGNKINISFRMPMILRAGIRYRPIERLAIEGAFVWEQWSRLQTVEIVPDDIRIAAPLLGLPSSPLPVVVLEKRNIDTFSGRLGVEAKPLDWLTARAGFFYESPASRVERFDIGIPDQHKLAITAGVSVKVWKLWFDAGYAHAFIPTVNVTNSANTLLTVLPGQPAPAIGNGTYQFSFDMVHFGVRAAFFDAPKAPPAEEPASTPASSDVIAEPSNASAPTTMPSP